MRTRASIVAGILALTALVAPGAQARPPSPDWKGSLFPIEATEIGTAAVNFDDAIDGSRARYFNGGAAVDFTLKARGLPKGHGYTVWLMVFNHPEFCLGVDKQNGYLCGASDHFNPAAGFSLMYGTGEVSTGDTVRFKGTRQMNSVPGRPSESDVLVGPGLINPAGAEVHFRIRDHGPYKPELYGKDQIKTFGGGCTPESNMFVGEWESGDYDCSDLQATGS